ncbi:MAG: hypothetical protein ACOZAR_01055 [Patescibacteria group bacterium]
METIERNSLNLSAKKNYTLDKPTNIVSPTELQELLAEANRFPKKSLMQLLENFDTTLPAKN